MKRLLIAGVFTFISSQAMAETWIARCNNLQFNFMRDAKSFLGSVDIYSLCQLNQLVIIISKRSNLNVNRCIK
jgi:hypothetical protein